MLNNLFLNGFVVKGCYDSISTQSEMGYRGIGKYTSWPLDDFDDELSLSLNTEANYKWFSFQNILEVVPDYEYLKRYCAHCRQLGVDTIVLKIESPNCAQQSNYNPRTKEVLGFDCISNVHYSFLYDDVSLLSDELVNHGICLNSNGLMDKIDDIFAYINIRKKALANGINLEDYTEEKPVKLSIVDIGSAS